MIEVSSKGKIDSIDNIIAPMETHLDAQAIGAALSPDLLVTIGGAVVSKKIKNLKFIK